MAVEEQAEIDRLRGELDATRRENMLIKGVMPMLNAPCIYCEEANMAKCPQGFPGCSQADDLLVAQDVVGLAIIDELKQFRLGVLTLAEQLQAQKFSLEECLKADLNYPFAVPEYYKPLTLHSSVLSS